MNSGTTYTSSLSTVRSTSRNDGSSFQNPVLTSSKTPVSRIVSAWSYVGVLASGFRWTRGRR